jgi:hypothetical protein
MMLMHCAFWGAFATVVLTILLAGSQGFGFTRMNVPFLLGTIVTPNRDRAKLYGILIHLINGVLFAWLYLVGFQFWGGATWWKGLVFGAVHAGFLLTGVVTLLPGMHPRMATEEEGPTLVRQLEPPGFLGLYYGRRTPLSVLLAHLAFGLILGMTLPHAE